MKKAIYLISAAAMLLASSCSSDDTEVFDIKPAGGFTFTPRPGGAVMKYTLPDNSDINNIRVRYNDVNGKEVTVLGSYLSDSLNIVGFNEARNGIKAYVSYINRQGMASEEYVTTFSTSDSGPYAFFNEAEIVPAWDGFQLSYNLPENGMEGYAHVFCVGKNPNTGKSDTLLLNTITLKKGQEQQFFKISQNTDANTIVIKTEDFRGYFVKTGVWKDIKAYPTRLIEGKDMDVECPLSYENPEYAIGLQYLTDGDNKGRKSCLNEGLNYGYFTFVMGPNAFGEPIILDLHEADVVANVRVYAQLSVKSYYSKPIWNLNYTDTLPCELEVYGSNDKKSWDLLGSYSEPDDESGTIWYKKDGQLIDAHEAMTLEQLEASPASYVDITMPISDKKHRYVKVVPVKCFDTSYPAFKNSSQYVTMQELEIYVKK